MAYIVPSNISDLELKSAQFGELHTLYQLKTQLPAAYTVYHSVHWVSASRQIGEVDFFVVNQSGDILLIEQKNGALQEDGEDLFKSYRNDPRGAKSVTSQIFRNKDGIEDKLKAVYGDSFRTRMYCLIFSPDHTLKKLNAASLQEFHLHHAGSQITLAEKIMQTLGDGILDETGQAEKIHEFFCQSMDLIPDIHSLTSQQTLEYIKLVGGLKDVVSNLSFTPFRLCVNATAGAGKSQVAVDYFIKESERGQKVALLCFNNPLASRFRSLLSDKGYVNTWMGLSKDILESQGEVLDFVEMYSNDNFWSDIHEQVISSNISDEWKFDTIIVDEGQDFKSLWFEMIGLFLNEDGNLLWLQDSRQALLNFDHPDLSEFVTYNCADNYRTPQSIARFIKKHLDKDINALNVSDGMGVYIERYDSAEGQIPIVAKRVKKLRAMGFNNDQIAIISLKGKNQTVFKGLDKIGTNNLIKFTGDYNEKNEQIYSNGEILFETIYRFKGQQRPAIILVDVDPKSPISDFSKNTLYTAMTRATVRLEIVTKRGNDVTKDYY